MKQVLLTPNTHMSTSMFCVINDRQYQELIDLSHSGGFKRFSVDLFDEGKHITQPTPGWQIDSFLKGVFPERKDIGGPISWN